MAKIPINPARSEQVRSAFGPTVAPVQRVGQVSQPVRIPTDTGIDSLAASIGTTADVLIARRNRQVAEDETNFLVSEQLRINKSLADGTKEFLDTRGTDSFNSGAKTRKEAQSIKPSQKLSQELQNRWNNTLESSVQKASNTRFRHEFAQREEIKSETVAGLIQDATEDASINDDGTMEMANNTIDTTTATILAVRGIEDSEGNQDIVEGIRLSVSNSYYDALLNRKMNATIDGNDMAIFFEENKEEMAQNMTVENFKKWANKANSLKDGVQFVQLDAVLENEVLSIIGVPPGTKVSNRAKIAALDDKKVAVINIFGQKTFDKALSTYRSLIAVEDNNRNEADRLRNNDVYSKMAASLEGTPTVDKLKEAISVVGKSDLSSIDKFNLEKALNSTFSRGVQTDPAVFRDLSNKVLERTISGSELVPFIGFGLSIPDWSRLQAMTNSLAKGSTQGLKRFQAGLSGVVAFAKENGIKIADANDVNRELDRADIMDEVASFMSDNGITDFEDPKVLKHLRNLKESKDVPAGWFRSLFSTISKTGNINEAVTNLSTQRQEDTPKDSTQPVVTVAPSEDEVFARKTFPSATDAQIQQLISNPEAMANLKTKLEEQGN